MASRVGPDDWRRQGQEKYLHGANLVHQLYAEYRPGWDHDHCEFCGRKLSMSDGDLREGYSTEDCYRWICPTCFMDFQQEFEWTVKEEIGPDRQV